MSLKAEVVLFWGDSNYTFSLKGAQIEELEFQCGKIGFGAIYQRMRLGTWFYKDIYHTIRLGLIGGGMDPVRAKQLTEAYMPPMQPMTGGSSSPEMVAQAIILATMMGVEDLKPGEVKAGQSPAKEQTSAPTARPS